MERVPDAMRIGTFFCGQHLDDNATVVVVERKKGSNQTISKDKSHWKRSNEQKLGVSMRTKDSPGKLKHQWIPRESC